MSFRSKNSRGSKDIQADEDTRANRVAALLLGEKFRACFESAALSFLL